MHLRSGGLGTVRPTPGSRLGVLSHRPLSAQTPISGRPLFLPASSLRSRRTGRRAFSRTVPVTQRHTVDWHHPEPDVRFSPPAHAGAGARYAAREMLNAAAAPSMADDRGPGRSVVVART